MTLHLAHPLHDPTLQAEWERAQAVRAADDPAAADPAWGAERIFVSIAAYRDPECHQTVQDLFAKASRPERITVGLVWQLDPVEDAAFLEPPLSRPGQVRTLTFDWREARGVCWARFLAQGLWRGEEYVLQIDSHMRFERGWDEIAIAELASCPSEKALLASMPPAYTPPDERSPLYPGILRTDGFLDDGCIRFTGVWLPDPAPHPLRSAFLMAGGLFTRGRFIEEVPYDPYLNFENEESTLAIRAYTHGWDVYCPAQRWLWHRLIEEAPKSRPLYFNDMARIRGAQAARERNRRAFLRFNHLTRHKASDDPGALLDLDLFGFGAVRTIEDFEDFSGLCFRTKRASEHAVRARFIPDLDRVVRFDVGVLKPDAPWRPKLMHEGELQLRRRLRGMGTAALVDETIRLMGLTTRQQADLDQATTQLKVKELLVKELAGILRGMLPEAARRPVAAD